MGSVRFTVTRTMPFAPADVWRLMTHWPAHARWVPLTTIAVDATAPPGVGARFVARTGVGPLAFDDVMVVTRWEPPGADGAGVVEVRKDGRVVLGTAAFAVVPTPDGGSLVTWTEDVDVAPVGLTRHLAWLIAPPSRAGFASALKCVERDLRDGLRGPGQD